MMANAVRGRPPEPARKLQVCRPAAGAWNSHRVKELRGAAGRWNCIRSRTAGMSLQRTPVGVPGRCRPPPRRAGRVVGESACVERDMMGVCLSRRGKIATADVMDCYWCDWSDAPDRMDGCYSPVTFDVRGAARSSGGYCPGVLRIGLTGG